MKYIDAEKLIAEINNLESFSCISEEQDGFYSAISRINGIIDSLQQEQPEAFDTAAFQKGVQEGRRLEREDALTIADIEQLHTFLYAVKNNKHGAFTFTRLSDEQYEEDLRRFNNAKEK